MTEREPVGTVAEEAAKLLAAMHSWTGDRGTDESAPTDEHGAHAPQECEWCPWCRLVRRALATSPEVREHLSQAAISLALAVKGMLDEPRSEPDAGAGQPSPLETIDVTEE